MNEEELIEVISAEILCNVKMTIAWSWRDANEDHINTEKTCKPPHWYVWSGDLNVGDIVKITTFCRTIKNIQLPQYGKIINVFRSNHHPGETNYLKEIKLLGTKESLILEDKNELIYTTNKPNTSLNNMDVGEIRANSSNISDTNIHPTTEKRTRRLRVKHSLRV